MTDELTFQGIGCDVCHREFDDLDEFIGHDNPDGEPCEGGSAYA